MSVYYRDNLIQRCRVNHTTLHYNLIYLGILKRVRLNFHKKSQSLNYPRPGKKYGCKYFFFKSFIMHAFKFSTWNVMWCGSPCMKLELIREVYTGSLKKNETQKTTLGLLTDISERIKGVSINPNMEKITVMLLEFC